MDTTDQPLGQIVPGWQPPEPPDTSAALNGTYVRLEPLAADRHSALLFRAFAGNDGLWTYMPVGPFSSAAQFHRWVREKEQDPSVLFYAIQNRSTGTYQGVASYLRILPTDGSIEIGNITFGSDLQRTVAATEAIYLMMAWAFDAGYRRVEWKCNALNKPSRRAAQRLGFNYEGIFRQATVVKGRNRDTAWFAAIDTEWPALKEAFAVWLATNNFDLSGGQRESLSDLTRLVRVTDDPSL